ncbi:hypothetical protein ABPG72_021989 [Tetrahymena utriculariae]
MQDLPYWASYFQASSSLILQLEKNYLQSSSFDQQNNNQAIQVGSTQYSNQTQIQQQQFVFSVSQMLSNTGFLNSNLSITSQFSQQIFIDCILANLIAHDYQVIQTSQNVIKDLLQNKYQQIQLITYIMFYLKEIIITQLILQQQALCKQTQIMKMLCLPFKLSVVNFKFLQRQTVHKGVLSLSSTVVYQSTLMLRIIKYNYKEMQLQQTRLLQGVTQQNAKVQNLINTI